MDTTLLLILFLIGLLIWRLCSKPPKFPPGPPRWPVVGNLLSLRGRLVHEVASDISDKYGDVSAIYLGETPLVIISGLAAAKEAGAREELSGRPVSKLALDLGGGRIHGLIFTQGEWWREQRRFTLRHLRDLGFGKHSMEGLIHEEVNSLIREFDRKSGRNCENPVDLFNVLGTSIVNILWHIIAGQRYEHGDARLQRLLVLSKELLTQTDASGGIAQNFPLLLSILPWLTEKDKIVEVRNNVYNFVKEDLAFHKETLDPENPRDFLDIFLIEMANHKGDLKSSFCKQQLLDICKDLFVAGSDTSFNSLTFALTFMVNYPEVQQKVQEELDQVIGQDRLPGLDDRAKLVYTEATLQEAMRMSSVVPLGVPHAPLATGGDVAFRGYVIPKTARVLINIAHIHMDPKIWGDPQNFRPERFISDEGKLLRPEALMPFGSGKRQCLGESLARNNFYLIFTAIMQRYQLSMPPGETLPSLAPTGGFTVAPKSYLANMKSRFSA